MSRVFRSFSSAFAFGVLALLASHPVAADVVVDFDDLSLAPNSYFNGPMANSTIVSGQYGPELAGTFASHGVEFANSYSQQYDSWSGFAYSNNTDKTTPGFLNQFSAITGSGRGGSGNYGVAFGHDDLTPNLVDPVPFDPTNLTDLRALPNFTLPTGAQIAGMYVTNTAYAYFSMTQGDQFTGGTPFGGAQVGGLPGTDPDYFLLRAYGTDAMNNILPTSVDFYLADYRSSNSADDYIVNDWRYMDLSALSGATQVYFNVSGSKVGVYGLDTPGTFAVDDIQLLQAVPEPSSLALIGIGVIGIMTVVRRRNRSRA